MKRFLLMTLIMFILFIIGNIVGELTKWQYYYGFVFGSFGGLFFAFIYEDLLHNSIYKNKE